MKLRFGGADGRRASFERHREHSTLESSADTGLRREGRSTMADLGRSELAESAWERCLSEERRSDVEEIPLAAVESAVGVGLAARTRGATPQSAVSLI